MIQFAWPWILVVLPLPWVVRHVAPPAPPSGSGTLFAPFSGPLQSMAGSAGSVNSRFRWAMGIVIWLLLMAAAARPQWLGEPMEMPESGRNLMLAVDVSGSMEEPDLDPRGGGMSRLDVVKQVAGQFIERREGDRVGLILFGSQAYIQTPLTFDRTTVKILLEQALIGIAGRETAIGDAIGLAVKRMREAPEGQAILVLLTDGANTAGRVAPKQAADLAAQAGLRIHTIGVGSDRASAPGLFGSILLQRSGGLDDATLRAIAKTTGGEFFRATDRSMLEQVYARLDQLEPIEAGNRVVRPITALYPWPLGLAFILSLTLVLPTGLRSRLGERA